MAEFKYGTIMFCYDRIGYFLKGEEGREIFPSISSIYPEIEGNYINKIINKVTGSSRNDVYNIVEPYKTDEPKEIYDYNYSCDHCKQPLTNEDVRALSRYDYGKFCLKCKKETNINTFPAVKI